MIRRPPRSTRTDTLLPYTTLFRSAMLLMEQHLSKALTLDEMAGKLNVSSRQFERVFKADTGKTPQAFARAMRLRVAAWALLNTDKRSEEHTSELQSLMRISYAVFCLKKKTKTHTKNNICQ